MVEINLEEIETTADEKIEKLKVSAGTIRRIITLVVQGVLSIAGIAWGQEILVNEGVINNIVGWGSVAVMVLFVAFQLWSAWKNNSLTKKALIADKELKAMKEGTLTITNEAVAVEPSATILTEEEVE